MEDSIFNFNDDIINCDSDTQKNAPGRKKKTVWNYFAEVGEKKHGHVGCRCLLCKWTRGVGKAHEMVEHLAFSCPNANAEVKNTFIQEVRNRKHISTTASSSTNASAVTKKRLKMQDQKITSMFDSTTIDSGKEHMCNRALTRFFVCCGIPFRVISNPFFMDFVKSLCPSYNLPNRITFATSWINDELAQVMSSVIDLIGNSSNITLGLDGWCTSQGTSIYAFILILPSRKEIVYSLKDLSSYSHTSELIFEITSNIIEEVGSHKFSAIVSDNASTMVAAKRKINEKYNNIIPIRCITHHVNLLTTDIMKHEHSKKTIENCMKLVNFFKKSYQSGSYLSKELKENLVIGGGLTGYTKTRWTTAYNCLISIKRCESSLVSLLEKHPEILKDEIKDLLRNRFFFQDVEELSKILQPIKEVLVSLEYKTTTLADCFIQLMKLGIAFKQYPDITNVSFRLYCLDQFNKRWRQFDFEIYLLGYFLHPLYRGKGFKSDVFRRICHTAIGLWVTMGGGEFSSGILVAQLLAYKNFAKPYEFHYVKEMCNIETWWNMIDQNDNFIQQLALKIISITPHNIGCERMFSTLGWMCSSRRSRLSIERMEAMAKLHTFYVTNAATEMNYVHSGIDDKKFQEMLNQSLTEEEEEIDEDKNNVNENLEEDEKEVLEPHNEIIMEKYFNLNDQEFRKALEIEVRVVIEENRTYDHGNKEFDINALINANIDMNN